MVLETYNFVMSHKFLRVMILALLVFSVIFCGFMVEHSHAFAWAIPAVAVCATLLVACGVISATDTDLESVATAFHNSLNSQASQEILAIASEYSKVTSGGFTFRPTKAIVNALVDWISGCLSQDAGSLIVSGGLVFGGVDMSWCPVVSLSEWTNLDINKQIERALPFYKGASDSGTRYYIPYSETLKSAFNAPYPTSSDTFYIYGTDSNWFWLRAHNADGKYYSSVTGTSKWDCLTHGILVEKDGAYSFLVYNAHSQYRRWLSFFDSASTTFPTTSVKTDTTYFPKEVVNAAGGATTFPSNTASKPLTTETPLTIPQEGVNSTTLPTDVRTDAGTSEGEQTGTIIGWLEKVWDGVCAIPDAIAGAGTAVIDFVTDLVVPSDTVWDDFMTDVVDIVSPPNTVNFNKYVSSIAIPDVTVNWKGRTLTIVDNSNLRNNVTTWRKYIGAFLAVLLMIYNYNMFMKLMGLGTLTLTESGRVPDVSINNLSGNVALPAPKGKR